MKKMKSLVLILVLALSAWTLTGCGGMSEDEAKEYAQAVLDASYKGEFDSYMELTDSTEEEAREMYEDVYKRQWWNRYQYPVYTALSDSY